MTVREIVAGLIDPVAEQRYRHVLCREADTAGFQRGWVAGRRALLDELARSQAQVCVGLGPEWRLLEERQFGPLPGDWVEPRRGAGEDLPGWRRRVSEARRRARAGDPRPGDFEGGSVRW